jgi:hypothetical protein
MKQMKHKKTISKLFPAQPKNREEFYQILEDIGMVTNKHEDFVPVNNSESFFVVT